MVVAVAGHGGFAGTEDDDGPGASANHSLVGMQVQSLVGDCGIGHLVASIVEAGKRAVVFG